MSQRVKTSAPALVLTRSSQPENGHLRKKYYSSVNGRFRVETTELRCVFTRCDIQSERLKQEKNRLNIYLKPGMSHYIPCLIAE
jgi:uncharacterized protein YnzC (UPF0291/DUF896 family)